MSTEINFFKSIQCACLMSYGLNNLRRRYYVKKVIIFRARTRRQNKREVIFSRKQCWSCILISFQKQFTKIFHQCHSYLWQYHPWKTDGQTKPFKLSILISGFINKQKCQRNSSPHKQGSWTRKLWTRVWNFFCKLGIHILLCKKKSTTSLCWDSSLAWNIWKNFSSVTSSFTCFK